MEFNDKNCNGWVIMRPECIEGDSPKNFHIVEVKITRENCDGKIVKITRNTDDTTLCAKCKVKSGTQKYSFLTENECELRGKMSQMQNGGYEMCGVCASRLYADDDVKDGN